MHDTSPRFSPNEFRRALDAAEFVPYFQPLVTLRTRELVGFEVLTRWKHSQRGVVLPNAFVPTAEEQGWIGALTRAVVRRAFLAAAPLPGGTFTLSINVSPLQLRDDQLAEQIAAIAGETGFELNRLKIEITESALAENLVQARGIAAQLKAMGCRVALDDFGTGYSSLAHLHALPIDEIKVDRSFVISMEQRRESRKIVAAVVGLGQSLGLTTVAEGVETEEQEELLLWLGCDVGQGWLYGRPQPEDKLAEMIAAGHSRESAEGPARKRNVSAAVLEGLPAVRLAQLQAVYDGAPVGLAFVDRELKYVNINRRLAEMHGVSIEEHLGRRVPEVVPAKFAQIESNVRSALGGVGKADVEFTVAGSAGEGPITYIASYQPVRDEAGEVIGVSCAVLDFTERKRAEERLRHFERLVEGLEEIIAVCDHEYRMVLANRAFLEYVGTTEEQCIGRKVDEVVGWEAFEQVMRPRIDECLRGRHVEYEMKWTHPLRGERDLEVSYSPIDGPDGSRAVACVVRDVTDRKRLELLQMTLQRHMEMSARAGFPIGYWDWDLHTDRVEWSPEMFRQWGVDPARFSGRLDTIMGQIYAADRDAVNEVVRKALAREIERYSVQFRIVRPDGSICWVETQGVVLSEDSHRIVGLSLDITELKKVQESLRESKEGYLRLLNSAGEAIYAVDPEGNCTFCNAACVQVLRVASSSDLLGRNMHEAMHHTRPNGEPYPEQECTIYGPIRGGTGTHIPGEVLWRADGTSFSAEIWSYPLWRGDEFLGGVVSFFDVSGREAVP